MVSVLAVTFGLALAGSQTSVPPLNSMIDLSLVATEERIFQRAPAAFEIEVQNRTDVKLTVALVLTPAQRQYVTFRYRRIPEAFRRLTYTAEWDHPGPHEPGFRYFVLAPNGSGRFRLSLAADVGRSAFVFDEPGEYEIQLSHHALWRGPNDVITTPPLRIRVEPAPRSETDALADWDVDLAVFAQNDAGGATSSAPRFRRDVTRALKFIDKHPDSLYSRALRQRTLDTLALLRREGRPLTEYEQDAFERLKRVVREEAQRDAASR